MRLFGIAALATLVVAVPAHAADLATIDCVIGKLKPALQAQISKDVTRNMGEGAGVRPTYDPAVGSGISVAARECSDEHKWSETALEAARVYTLAKLGQPIAETFVAAQGFDVGELESQFDALPEDARNRPLTTEEMQKLVIASVTDEAKQTRANAALLNKYFLFLSTVRYAAWQFSEA
ncbi:hypothetical protein J2W22_002823 [Sphingomonas kyeonggiensis]|uniref:hypothetical protein n=1 Tax=Sphingomonas kyeonggiensis TaxID=1268553 RepID=UPI002786AD66|nr:hypothetical protein [Sphingomonas kyeonggiensis]MDQ0250759.1 hypothetical protein [Sphingomonas kyeonggiensis]